jgi:hypothetical protein
MRKKVKKGIFYKKNPFYIRNLDPATQINAYPDLTETLVPGTIFQSIHTYFRDEVNMEPASPVSAPWAGHRGPLRGRPRGRRGPLRRRQVCSQTFAKILIKFARKFAKITGE